MKQHSKFMTALVTALLMSAHNVAHAADASQPTKHKKARRTVHSRRTKAVAESASARQMREMHEQLAAQQAEIDALKNQVSTRDSQVAAAQQSAADAQQQVASAAAATAAATAQTTQNAQDVQQLKASVGDLSTQNTTLQQTVVQNQQQVQGEINSPTALHYKGLTIQPIGFAAFEGVWRQRSVNSDINTPFNSIPFPSALEGHVSELNFSGRQSRIGALFSGDTGKLKLAAYLETDFLGTGTSSNNNQSDSYVLRFRQFWGQAATGGTTLTGGQMWSLVTEDARGTDNRTEVLPNTVDPQYMVGFSWARQPGIRLQQAFGDPHGKGGLTLAVSLEQAQITNFTVNAAVASAVPADFFFAGPGQNGGLYNAAGNIGNNNAAGTGGITNYANNVAPDIMVKAAFDAPHAHLELGGVARFMRDYYYPVLTATSPSYLGAVTYTYAPKYQSYTAKAGGAFASFRVSPVKLIDFGVSGMIGDGTGRYGSSQLADATIRPNGTLEPIRNAHALASVIGHPGKNFDVFAYYGGEYAQRTIYATAGANLIGYGTYNLNDSGCYALPPIPTTNGATGTEGSITPLNCGSPTRYIQEGMFGFIYRAYNNPRYGRLQYTATYSYLQRNLWSGSVATGQVNGPRAEDSMVHVGMRYYIP